MGPAKENGKPGIGGFRGKPHKLREQKDCFLRIVGRKTVQCHQRGQSSIPHNQRGNVSIGYNLREKFANGID